jgi:hypothetical protein
MQNLIAVRYGQAKLSMAITPSNQVGHAAISQVIEKGAAIGQAHF